MSTRAPIAAVTFVVVALVAGGAAADEPGATADDTGDILKPSHPYFRVEAVNVAFAHFDQTGRGYQSRAGAPGGPGDQALLVEQPQAEVIVAQGEHVKHRLWIPVDVVTAASPDAIDVVSTASLRNEAGSFDWTTTYDAGDVAASIRNGFHAEENYHSWNSGIGAEVSLAEENTVISGSVNEVLDWFDEYELDGSHHGHTSRNAINGNAGVTQILSPTTLAHVEAAVTLQTGELSNGWNIVPLEGGAIVQETLPDERFRSAFVARIAQYLPFEAAVRASYRFYVDDWGIVAHTGEVDLQKRLASFSRLRVSYRLHDQSTARFFTTRSVRGAPGFRTSDSDLDAFTAQTVGFAGIFDVPVSFARTWHVDFGLDRYFRSNDLQMTVYSIATGLLF